MPARTIAAVMGPGSGHHLVKAVGGLPLALATLPRRARSRKRPVMISALP